ncbi:hypothetical protein [Sulfitobacter sp.]|uniref:hypothetical protein n=1 Tax=Sulfitobacter sp. TaxID=1903071 RepID=UPI00329850F7
MQHAFSLGLAILAFTAPQAFAQDAKLGFSAEFSVEVENDFTFDATDSGAEVNNLNATIEGAITYRFSPSTYLHLGLVFEQLGDPEGDSEFEDHGLYAEELFLSHDFGRFTGYTGKFNVAYGLANDEAPGIYGTDFVEDYEITERVGAGLSIPVEFAGGSHEIYGALFQADRSFLSDSIGFERGQLDLDDGGVSNTKSLSSFVAGITGEVSGTAYSFAVQRQAEGEGDTDDQTGATFSATHDFGQFVGIGEVAYFDSFDGTNDSATYISVGAAVPLADNINLSGVYGYRDIEGGTEDTLATLTVEYEFTSGVVAAVGYRYGDEDGVKSDTLGVLVGYEF